MPASIKYFPLLLALAALPACAETVRVYVTNSAGDSIHVIDPATNKVVQVINGVEAAHGIDFSPDGQRVYVSNEADSTLDVIDRASGKTMTKVRLSGHPNNISATKDGGRVVVGIAEDPGALDVIDTRALKLARTIPVNGRLHNVYVTPDNKYVVTGSIRSKLLTVIDLDRRETVILALCRRTPSKPIKVARGSVATVCRHHAWPSPFLFRPIAQTRAGLTAVPAYIAA